MARPPRIFGKTSKNSPIDTCYNCFYGHNSIVMHTSELKAPKFENIYWERARENFLKNFLKLTGKHLRFSKCYFLHSYNAFYGENSIISHNLEFKAPKLENIFLAGAFPKFLKKFLTCTHRYIRFSKSSFLHSYEAFYHRNSIIRYSLEV